MFYDRASRRSLVDRKLCDRRLRHLPESDFWIKIMIANIVETMNIITTLVNGVDFCYNSDFRYEKINSFVTNTTCFVFLIQQ